MAKALSLFEAFGIELEYMVVDSKGFQVRPIVDTLFSQLAGGPTNVISGPGIDWSNELVAHVIEFKNPIPHVKPYELRELFHAQVLRANQALQARQACLLPGAVHPWMNPDTETRLWPHENNQIYSAYDRIFGCRGHGWSNLQSLHINLSFATDLEFAQLHSAVRVILPLIPALSASSPFLEGQNTDFSSCRLNFYLQNQRRIPSILGEAIPEVVHSKAEYQEKILQPMYRDVAPFDPDGDLQEEWLNSRGAIPKFERGCLEIRLADVQEAPHLDLAIASFWIETLRRFVLGKGLDLQLADSLSPSQLKLILQDTIRSGEKALITDRTYLSLFGLNQTFAAGELLTHLHESLPQAEWTTSLGQILRHGTLSTRMRRFVGQRELSRELLQELCQHLAICLQKDQIFAP